MRDLRSAEGRSIPEVATYVLLVIKGSFSRSRTYYPEIVLACSDLSISRRSCTNKWTCLDVCDIWLIFLVGH